jgi:glycosyltransferase involved in cell wall biosynthesis
MRPKILFFITEDWFFCSHFLNRAIAAQRSGYEVTVVTHVTNHGDKINSHGLNLISVKLVRRGMNPLHELRLIWTLIRIFKSVQPELVHNIALKPIFYGSLAAFLARVPFIVNAPVGMGFIFSSQKWQATFFRPFVLFAYHLFLNPVNSCVIFENPDDLHMMTSLGAVSADRSILIRGAGVDLDLFSPRPEPDGVPVVILAARMLWDKGVGEFVEASRILQKDGIQCRMVLVGDPDEGNPASIKEQILRHWQSEGAVEWWGHQDNMTEMFAQSNIVVLPSYREGLPKVLLEAASCGRAIIATDVPGCREIVHHNKNGFLVPPRDSTFLADAIKKLIENPDLRTSMGVRGREIVRNEFSEEIVIEQTMALYKEKCAQEKCADEVI